MKSVYRYFKLLFSDDEKLIAQWNQLTDGEVSGKYREAMAKELQKRYYRHDGANWVKSSN